MEMGDGGCAWMFGCGLGCMGGAGCWIVEMDDKGWYWRVEQDTIG